MSLFVKIETDALTNAKLLDAGLIATAVWLRGLLYSKVHLTDGFVPAPAIRLLALGADDPEVVASILVDCGLWAEAKGGWTVGPDNWARHQTSREQVEAKREADAERKRLARASRVRDVSARSPDGRATDATDVSAPRPRCVRAESALQSTEHRVQSTDKRESPKSPPASEGDAAGMAAAPPPAPEKPKKAKGDPLAAFPALADAYPSLESLVTNRHPYAKPSPAWRKEIAAAVRLDGVPESDLIAAIRWTFAERCDDSKFWARQVQGFGGLRASKGGKPSNLQRILNAWASKGAKRRPAPEADPAPRPEIPIDMVSSYYQLTGAGMGRTRAADALKRLKADLGAEDARQLVSRASKAYHAERNKPATLDQDDLPTMTALLERMQARHSANGVAKA